ncbi:MAG: NAD(P)-binding protein [Coriobacteriia bacterium]|nr:NAD(P)-binding protein [Coriobacteriia bacterium]
MEQDELREWERKCIQEEAPGCTAACPIHVDARLFAKEMARGDWEAAFQALARSMPFPGILARICDHPCEMKCKRREVDDPIALGALERFCIERTTGKVRPQLLPRREQTIAVLGGGLAGLTVAWDLRKKGFGVTIFEPSDRIGGSLWDLAEHLLPPGIIREELAVLDALKTEIRLDETLNASAFETICREYEAVFVDREATAECDLPLGRDREREIAVDAASGGTSQERVYAGGGTRRSGTYSPINEAYQGRKGALSIERFIQKAQMSAGRESEGPFDTRLFTSLDGIEKAPRMRPANVGAGFDETEARAEASRCIQCECMECTKVCLYLERYDGYPKKYARQIFGNERVVLGAAHTKNQFVNSCSDCGLCETVCPNSFDMGDLCLQARRTMRKQEIMPASFHEFALQDMAYSNGERFALSRNEPGRTASAWLYFPSCQLCATSPGEVLASYRYLRERLTGGVGIMLGCCGAPAFWAGRDDLFEEAMGTLRRTWESMGRPNVITACSNCRGLIARHLPDVESISLWKVLEDNGLPLQTCAASGTTVSIADPCTTRHDRETQDGIRRIAQSLGIAVDELLLSRERPECCGYGGLMYNANPKLADDVITHRAVPPRRDDSVSPTTPFRPPGGWYRSQKLQDSDTAYYHTEVSAHDYLAYCAMCRDNLAAAGKRVSHLIELLFPAAEDTDPAARGWISWTERRSNRAKVKQGVLRELGEKGEDVATTRDGLALEMRPEVRRKIDERRILEDDIRSVIEHAESTGQRLHNVHSGQYRAYRQLQNVTFWVDYTPSGDDRFDVHNAYSHRMVIVGVKR